ncbi:MAG TPA: GGDEF domain-containing protein [Actinophytocola sp.]|uniref:GGDEF domain-containing protein n=1 Tax=Actinophytocola sp. TaxID=1872138 RepID=UPI002DDCA726|nr:GGDEF domain-containing protein [Actinophytocola sp.]HEV2784672.1 GGDEF domain-containing protein [Actinophytocola sp.]
MAVRDAGPLSPRGDADAEGALRILRARWRTASLASGWRFPSDWPLPEVDLVCASVLGRVDVCDALASLARARAQAGAGLEETLVDLAALHAVLTNPDSHDGLLCADPDATPSRLLRIMATAWADESCAELIQARATNGLTGLGTEAYLCARLGEIYRRAARHGTRVRDTHVLLVVTLDLSDVVGWSRMMAMLVVGDMLREVFNGGESTAVLGPSVAAVLAEREPAFNERALTAAWVMNERLHVDPDLRSAPRPELRVISLPDSADVAVKVVRHLGRA